MNGITAKNTDPKQKGRFPVVAFSDTAIVNNVTPQKYLDVMWDPGFLYNQDFPNTELNDAGAETSGSVALDFNGQYTASQIPIHVVCVEVSTNQQSSAETNITVVITAPSPFLTGGSIAQQCKVKIPRAGDTATLFFTLAARQTETENVVHVRAISNSTTGGELNVDVTGLVVGGQSSVSAFIVFPGSSRWDDYLNYIKCSM